MQRSSESIGSLAAALAKAQGELVNPEKSLTGSIRSPFPREPDRTFRYAPLAAGLDVVRKCLGRHEIATVQTTEIDKDAGLVRLTTILAHASGEWVSSEWPVCPLAEMVAPQRMGAALTYARRYALFALVGIAGEDDLDGPDIKIEQRSEIQNGTHYDASKSKPSRTSRNVAEPVLATDLSASLRDQLVFEIAALSHPSDYVAWARRSLSAKNSLSAEDAQAVEKAFQEKLRVKDLAAEPEDAAAGPSSGQNGGEGSIVASVPTLQKPRRVRDKRHLEYVAQQPCLVCGRRPSDPHHIRFAQPSALSRKVSDEFTVPLCRTHHRELHQVGDEARWWAGVKIDPLEKAQILWQKNERNSLVPQK
jgi:hypothetical protein